MKLHSWKFVSSLAILMFVFACPAKAQNLIVNGDFSAGNTGFSTDYVCRTESFSEPRNYNVISNPAAAFTNGFSSFGDHTTGSGLMLFADGFHLTLWSQTISVERNTEYIFSYWVTPAYPVNPPLLRFLVNGVPAGADRAVTTSPGTWQKFAVTFNSSRNTIVTLSIIDVNPNYWDIGNDFCIDDLSLVKGETDTIPDTRSNVLEWGQLYTWNMGPAPLEVYGLFDVVAIKGGQSHSLALKSDGTVWAWGDNHYGQLGNGTLSESVATPAQVLGLTNVVAIEAGLAHNLVLKNDGTVWVWGDNRLGQLGNGTFTTTAPLGIATPTQVPGLTNVTAIQAGGGHHSLALKRDGTVWAWGYNYYGQLGNGTFTLTEPRGIATPAQVSGLTNVVSLGGGAGHNLALKSNGTVWAWGSNRHGQLGNGTLTSNEPYGIATPAQVPGITNVVAVGGGHNHSLVIKNDGTVWAWGYNYYGQLGNGTFTLPFESGIATPAQVPGLTNVVSIEGGGYHSFAVKSDGTVWSWGYNQFGQLGNGTLTSNEPYGIATPAQVPGLTNVTAISGGFYHSLAIVSTPSATVSGTITLEDCVNSAQSLTFVFRPADNSGNIQVTTPLTANGAFSLDNIPRKSYTLWIKGSKWLAKTVMVDASNGDVSNVSALLRAGDANNDNSIDVLDLDVLIQSFDADPNASHWNGGAADFNCDNSVDVLDLDLLIRNFDLTGDA